MKTSRTPARNCRRLLSLGAVMALTISLFAAPVQLLSTRSAAVVPSASANGDSVAPRISADGRFILFTSSANELVTNANGLFCLNVFLYDRASNSMTLVSVNAAGNGGGNGDSIAGQVSSNGQYVVFQSDATDLVSGDTNGVTDIFVRDLQSGTTIPASVAANGRWPNSASTSPVMTPDGRWVAFVSTASNLVAIDNNSIADVFMRDMVSHTNLLVSTRATGKGSPPTATMDALSITPDGRYVTFFSAAAGIVPNVPAASAGEVYLRDRLAHTNFCIWVSSNAAATVAAVLNLTNMPSSHPVLSDDGRYVAFKTGWTNGTVSPGLPGVAAVLYFQHDAITGINAIVSTNGFAPWPSSDDVYGPVMTPDGRFIVFEQRETAGSSNYCSVRLWDQQTGTNILVSANTSGGWTTNTSAHTPAVSVDGRYVTFLSNVTNLAGIFPTNAVQIYRRDVLSATTTLLDLTTNGNAASDQSGVVPALSADGHLVVYATSDGGLVAGDNNRASDVFLWDAASGTNQLISRRNASVPAISGNLASPWGPVSISGDGTLVAFASLAGDLAPNDLNGQADVFVRSLPGNSNLLASAGLDGNPGQNGGSFNPIISADGRYVVFLSGATSLVANDVNMTVDVFRRNLQSGVTELVSLVLAGVQTNALSQNSGMYDASFPASSQDGRYIAFLACTNNGGPISVFWRDMNFGLTRLIATNSTARPITMSADGQRVGYFDSTFRFYVWDATLQAKIFTNPVTVVSAAISPAGNRLLCQVTNQLLVYDLTTGSNLYVFGGAVPIRSASSWSQDGRYLAFADSAGLAAGDNNNANDIYLLDLPTGTLTLASVNQAGTGSGNAASDWPAMSADGRFVVFRTFATDVAPGPVNPPSLIVFDRLTGSNRLLATGSSGLDWKTWLARPVLDTNGIRAAFQSWDSGLVAGDLNRAGDAFSADVNGISMADSDVDGIPDWWTMQYFGHPTGQAGDLSRAPDDADGDGVSNLAEYLAGTVPTNSSSALAVRLMVTSLSAGGSLNWPAVPGRSYQVLSATDLRNPVWQPYAGPATIVGSRGYLNVPAADTQRYFRVQCGN